MRRLIWCSCLVGSAFVVACEHAALPGPRGDGVLVLEVGGRQPSLRAALASMGRAIDAPHHLVEPAPVVEPGAGGAKEPAPSPGALPTQPPAAGPVPVAPTIVEPPEPRWTTVVLGEGETLIQLARRHLGDGRRYVDLLKWNGWTERDARRLPGNQPVKIMLSPK